MGLLDRWQQGQAQPAAPPAGGLLSRWQRDRAVDAGGLGFHPDVPAQAPPSAPAPVPASTGGMLSRWQSTRPAPPAPTPIADPAGYAARNGLTTVGEGIGRGEVGRTGIPPAQLRAGASVPSPTPARAGNPAFWNQAPAPAPPPQSQAPASTPRHMLELMKAQAAKPQGQLYLQALKDAAAEVWPTHMSTQASLGHNLAAPLLYGLKAVGEPFMAVPRVLRGVPGMDAALQTAGDLYKKGLPSPTSPYANAPADFNQRIMGMPPAPAQGPHRKPDSRSEVDQLYGVYPGFMAEDLAKLAPGALAGKFAPGGNAVFGDRARQMMEQAAAPQAKAQTDAEAALYADPRSHETIINQALRQIPLAGAAFDPQTASIGQKLGETSGNPLLGMGLDLVAGLSPLRVAGKIGGLAKGVARSLTMPEGLAGRVLGTEVNPLAYAGQALNQATEAGAGMLSRWLAAREEKLPDAQTPTTGLPAVPGEVSRVGPSPLGEPPLRAAEPPRFEPSRPAGPDPAPASPAPSAPARPPATLAEVQASLGAAKTEYGALNSQSISAPLSDAEKARMIFLRAALPELQKQLKLMKRAIPEEGVQYSGQIAAPAGWAQDLHYLVQSGSADMMEQFAARYRELKATTKNSVARRQALQELLESSGSETRGRGVQYHGTSNPLSRLDEGHYASQNIYGQGLYTTDAFDVAQSYTRKGAKRGGNQPSLYEVREKAPVQFFDLDKPIASNPQMAQEFTRILESHGQDEALLGLGPDAKFSDLFDEMRQMGVPADQVHEAFDSMAYAAREAGFGGWAHTGGKLTGKAKPHQVKIYFDPHEQVDILPKQFPQAQAPQVQTPSDVQYSGQAPQFNQGPGAGPQPRAPLAQPQAAPSAPPSQPSAPVSAAPVPGRNLAGEPKAPPAINRDIRTTMGMIARGETQAPDLLTRWKRNLSAPAESRISYGGDLPAGSQGAYHGKRDLIEVRLPADGETTFHELGHQIARHSPIIDTAPAGALSELDRLGDPTTPNVPAAKSGARSSWQPGMGEAYKKGEGWSEYLRLWMTHPEDAKLLAPDMTKHWEGWLDSQGDVGARMRQHQADRQAWQVADFGKRMDAQVMLQKTRNQLEAKSSKDDLTTRFLDRFHPLRKMRDLAHAVEEIRPTDDFYRKATMLASTVKSETNREIEDLRSIFEGVRSASNPLQAEQELRRYLLARRAQELHDREMRSGFDQADVDRALQAYNSPTNEDIAKRLYEFQDRQLQHLADSGMLSQESLAKIREKNQNYIPLQRHFELGAGELSNQRGGIAGASLKASNPIKVMRGSEREILDPLVSVIANTFTNRMAAAKNDVLRGLLKLWDTHGDQVGHFLSEEKAPLAYTQAQVGELLKEPKLRAALEDLGVDVAGVTPVELESLIEMLPEGSIARPNQALLDQNHLVAVRENGKTRYLKLSPEMHRAVTGIGSEFATDPASWINMKMGEFLRAGATSMNWKFGLRNMLRDSLVLPLVSRVGGGTNLPFFPFADGIVSKLRAAAGDEKMKELIARWQESGGKQEFAVQYADRTGSDQALYSGVLPSRGGRVVDAAKSLGRRAKTALGAVSEISEDATRLGHYKAAEAYFRAKYPHWSPEDIHLAAAFEARDTLDFSRRGSDPAVRWARANIPFLGAGMEGTRRQLEALGENPTRYLGAGAATMSLPTVLNQTGIPGLSEGQWNNPDYWQLDQRKRDNDTIVKNPMWDGKDPASEFFKMPREKGPAALFSQVPEWMMQAAKGDSAPLGQRATEMASNVAQDFLPAGVDPMNPKSAWNLLGGGVGLAAEMIGNYDSFRDRPIVPDWLSRQHPDPSQQYDDRSSVIARYLGSKLGWSPMMIDHALYGVGAGLGQTAINYVGDPVASALTGIPQAPNREFKDAGTSAIEMSGLQVNPGQPESVRRFDMRLKELKQLQDRAMAHPQSKFEAGQRKRTMSPEDRRELQKMMQSDKKISRWQSALKSQKDPALRARLEHQIRTETSRFTPAPGGKP